MWVKKKVYQWKGRGFKLRDKSMSDVYGETCAPGMYYVVHSIAELCSRRKIMDVKWGGVSVESVCTCNNSI